jgi:CRISPR system Cascade subunit CasB
LFSLIDSKAGQSLDFVRLLKQLQRFSFEDARQKVKAQWAQEFYGQPSKLLSEEGGA